MKRLALYIAASTGCAITTASAGSLLSSTPVPLDTLSAFESPGENWTLASSISGDPREEAAFTTEPGEGILANIAPKSSGKNLFTSWEHGDIEVELEFLMPRESNSGIYLQSRYEGQLFDSWGVENPQFSDCGGIYQRWLQNEKKGYEGVAPAINASRAPGLWQKLRIVFQAPRFDAAGAKTANARFVEVSLNGYLIHEDIEVTGPTRAAAHGNEKARAPLMIQGDHGPVAFRNIAIKHFDTKTVNITDLACHLRLGENLRIGDYEDTPPTKSPAVTAIDFAQLTETNNLAATFTGNFHIPTAGVYAFHADAGGPTQLIVDGEYAIAPLSPGGRSIALELEPGPRSFRLDYTHNRWTKARLALQVEGPGIPMTLLTPATKKSGKKGKRELIISPQDDRVRVQRAFIPHEPVKRLYTLAVGSPRQIHYAYDFDTATILHAWNGPFLDTFEMWDGRGNRQLAKPAGPLLTFPSKPTISFIQFTEGDFPNVPDQMWRSDGYTLNANGQPEFHARLAGLKITDRIEAASPSRGLKRTLTLAGDHSSWWTGVLLAEASRITPQGDDRYIIGERKYYLDVSAENKVVPFVRKINGNDQLMIWAPKDGSDTTLTYSLVW